MYSSKLCVSKRFSMSVTWNILYILPCSVNLRFTTLLKNQVEWIFRALLSCRHLYASCWFSWDILSLTKSLPENFRLLSSWDLLPRFLCLYIWILMEPTKEITHGIPQDLVLGPLLFLIFRLIYINA